MAVLYIFIRKTLCSHRFTPISSLSNSKHRFVLLSFFYIFVSVKEYSMSVSVQNISKNFGLQKALDDVSFSVESGEVVGFLGPNGAGKSTMMKIMTGYLQPDSGKVTVCGLDASSRSIEVNKIVGYLPEHNPLYLDMYVREYLSMVAGIYRLDNIKSRVDDIIERTGLTRECHKLIGSLSKGYRQRVGLSQALISDPQVVILDEPTTGLDPNQIIEVRDLIKSIGKEKTVILSTHIMQEVEAVCDRVIVIDRGVLRADGHISDIAIKANGGQVIEVEFDLPVDYEAMRLAINASSVVCLNNNRYRIMSATDVRRSVFKYAVDNSLCILHLATERSDMESLFHELTSH